MKLANNQAKEMENGHSSDLSFEELTKLSPKRLRKRQSVKTNTIKTVMQGRELLNAAIVVVIFLTNKGLVPQKGSFVRTARNKITSFLCV